MIRSCTLLAAIGLVVGGVATAPSVAHAQTFISGTQLARACASRAPADENACNGYIAGVLDQITGSPELKGSVCPPAGTKLSVLREAMGKFGAQQPSETKGSGVALVLAMIKTNYPCPGK